MIEIIFATLILLFGVLGMVGKTGFYGQISEHLLILVFFVATLPKSAPIAVMMTLFYLVFLKMFKRARSKKRVKGAVVAQKFAILKYITILIGLCAIALIAFVLTDTTGVEAIYTNAGTDEINVAVFVFLLVLFFGGRRKCES